MQVIILKALMLIFFLGMLYVNYLANALPINNRNQSQIARDYPSYFTPPGFTFSIWGLIYLLVGIVVFRALFSSIDDFSKQYSNLFLVLFFISCIINILWLFVWHYDKMILSAFIMLMFLISLIWIAFYVSGLNDITKISFSIYAGWVSIAFIANITIVSVKSKLPLFMNNQIGWYIAIMIIGLLLALIILFTTKNIPYTLVYAWAYFAIYMKHYKKIGYHFKKKFNIFNGSLLVLMIIGIGLALYLNDFSLF